MSSEQAGEDSKSMRSGADSRLKSDQEADMTPVRSPELLAAPNHDDYSVDLSGDATPGQTQR